MIMGIVKNWNSDKGWGFIEANDGEDYFFNVANIRPGQDLSLGDSVKFDFRQSQRGPSAFNILKIKSLPV